MSTYTSYYSINNGTRFEGFSGTSHSSVIARTRRLFSGEGYRIDTSRTYTGHLVLVNDFNELVIDIEQS